MNTKTHWKKLHNPDYLGAYSLDDKTMVVQISRVEKREIMGSDGKKDEAIVAELVGQKPMILNATNCKTIASLYGNYIEDWAGKKITLFIMNVRAFGTTTEALRVESTIPKSAMPELTPDHPKWNEAKEAISKGTTANQIRSKYQLSPKNEALLCSK
jgi:hypothetical protein